ncbi:hypothetical protein Moror_4025 [Moniliophthora roreri MCA 2997]|uniref:Uncharacterized protein n=2 Tax=Moniliophthora roreri TaxID=221103 RepID=V2XNE8_MONRO|nr:hypothetical protein Moror_4025 [Moniliophthora roreri MCA 2997]KAI3616123.1 hypothetical protein WG66_013898 [Moniliophthora roreri]
MHLISSNKNSRPQATVDLPLLVFRHGTKRKFLSRPESFEEMTRVVRRKFDIDQDMQIAFEVADYDVCGNERVEVDESAYQTMAPYLDEMHIVTTPAKQSESQRLIPNSKGKGKEFTTQNDSSLLITPTASGSEELDRVDEVPVSKQPESQIEEDVDQLINEEEELLEATKVVPETKPVSPSINVKPEPPVPKPVSSSNPKSSTTSKPPSTASKPPSTLVTTSTSSKPSTSASSKPPSSLANTTSSKPSTNTASKHSSPRSLASESTVRPSANTNASNPPPATEPRKADELFNDSVTVEDEIVVDEDENRFFLGRQFSFGVSDATKDKQKAKASKATIDEADIIDVDKQPERPISSVTRKFLGQTQSRTITEGDIEEERTISIKTSTSRRVPHSTAPSPSKSRSRFESEQDDGPPPATQGPFQTTSTQQTDLIAPDGRFKVYIEGPKKRHRAEFMTKSRHTVKKVLAGACKTFRLDAAQAHLEHHITDEDDSDIETYVKCKSDETIGKAGIKPGARLRVVVRGFEDEEDDEEEDEDEY